MTDIVGYVAGQKVNEKLVPIVLIIKFGGIFKVKSNIELYKDNYGHLTLKRSKFYKDKSTVKEGLTTDVSNLLEELQDAGLDIIEIVNTPNRTYKNVDASIIPSFSDFPIPP